MISSMIKMMKKLFILFVIIAVVFPIITNAETDKVILSNCVDSESGRFILNVVEIKVKFLGIQKVTIDNESLDIDQYVCSKLTNAKEIKIEYEPLEKEQDSFGRILAWVFVDDVLLQEDLLKNGYSKILSLNDDYLYSTKLKEAQKYAKDNNLGVWKQEDSLDVSLDTEEEKEENEENKSIFRIIIDFFKDIFSKIRKFIDNLINNILN